MGAHWEGLRLCSTQTTPSHRSFNSLRQGILLNHMKKASIKAVLKICCGELCDFSCPPHREATEGWRWSHTSSGCPEVLCHEFLGQSLFSGVAQFGFFVTLGCWVFILKWWTFSWWNRFQIKLKLHSDQHWPMQKHFYQPQPPWKTMSGSDSCKDIKKLEGKIARWAVGGVRALLPVFLGRGSSGGGVCTCVRGQGTTRWCSTTRNVLLSELRRAALGWALVPALSLRGSVTPGQGRAGLAALEALGVILHPGLKGKNMWRGQNSKSWARAVPRERRSTTIEAGCWGIPFSWCWPWTRRDRGRQQSLVLLTPPKHPGYIHLCIAPATSFLVPITAVGPGSLLNVQQENPFAQGSLLMLCRGFVFPLNPYCTLGKWILCPESMFCKMRV